MNNINKNNFEEFITLSLIIKKILIILFLLLMILYVIYHIFHGKYNLYSLIKNNQLEILQNKKNNEQTEIMKLKNNIDLLQINSLDEDFLDEIIKKNGYIKENEIIIYSNTL